jgi:hypothetical protein
MPGKRKETMDIREMLRHLQRGQSNRAVAKALGIDRKTVARYRTWATEQGLLKESLPSLSELQRLVEETLDNSPPPQNESSVEPYRQVVTKLCQEGVEVAAIHQRLKERGYTDRQLSSASFSSGVSLSSSLGVDHFGRKPMDP